jgi:hypothetical protein
VREIDLTIARRVNPLRLWRALLIWFVTSVVLALASSSLAEVWSWLDIILVVLVFVAWPLVLIVLSVRSAVGGHQTGWLVALGIPLVLGGFFMAANTIDKASVYIHFLARKGVYDRLVAEGRAGRLNAAADQKSDLLRGQKYGVRYYVYPTKPFHIEFVWIETDDMSEGIGFDSASQGLPGTQPGFPEALGDGYRHSRAVF